MQILKNVGLNESCMKQALKGHQREPQLVDSLGSIYLYNGKKGYSLTHWLTYIMRLFMMSDLH